MTGLSKFIGGAERDRTVGLLNAIQALSQLSYSPTRHESNVKITCAKTTCQIHGQTSKQELEDQAFNNGYLELSQKALRSSFLFPF